MLGPVVRPPVGMLGLVVRPSVGMCIMFTHSYQSCIYCLFSFLILYSGDNEREAEELQV